MARLPSSQMSVSEQRFLWATLSRLLLKTLVGSGDYFLVCLLGFVVDGIFFSYYNSNRFGRIFLFQSSLLSLIKCHRMSVKNLRVVGQLRVSFFVHTSDLENKCRMLKIATDIVFLCQIHWKVPVCKDRLFKWEQQKISWSVQLNPWCPWLMHRKYLLLPPWKLSLQKEKVPYIVLRDNDIKLFYQWASYLLMRMKGSRNQRKTPTDILMYVARVTKFYFII